MSTQSFVQKLHALILVIQLALAGFGLPLTDWAPPQDQGQEDPQTVEERNEDESEPDPDPQP